GVERLSESDGPEALVVPTGRRRGGPIRGRDSPRARRGSTDSLAHRRSRRTRRSDPASTYGVEGRRRARARAAGARSSLRGRRITAGMVLRMLVLLAVGTVACFSAVASAAHETGAAPAARIPALPPQDTSRTGLCPIPATFRPAFARAARDSGLQLS